MPMIPSLRAVCIVLVALAFGLACGGPNPADSCCDMTGQANPESLPPAGEGFALSSHGAGSVEVTLHVIGPEVQDDGSATVRLSNKVYARATASADNDYVYTLSIPATLEGRDDLVLRAHGQDAEGNAVQGFFLPVAAIEPRSADAPITLPPMDAQTTLEYIGEISAWNASLAGVAEGALPEKRPDRGFVRMAATQELADALAELDEATVKAVLGSSILTGLAGRHLAYKRFWAQQTLADPTLPDFSEAWSDIRDIVHWALENQDGTQQPHTTETIRQVESELQAYLDLGPLELPGWLASCRTAAAAQTAGVNRFLGARRAAAELEDGINLDRIHAAYSLQTVEPHEQAWGDVIAVLADKEEDGNALDPAARPSASAIIDQVRDRLSVAVGGGTSAGDVWTSYFLDSRTDFDAYLSGFYLPHFNDTASPLHTQHGALRDALATPDQINTADVAALVDGLWDGAAEEMDLAEELGLDPATTDRRLFGCVAFLKTIHHDGNLDL